eukprot:scaffold82138_cov84-Attheya_sp.AAC.1
MTSWFTYYYVMLPCQQLPRSSCPGGSPKLRDQHEISTICVTSSKQAHFCPGHAKPIKCTNAPFKFMFMPLDMTLSVLSGSDVPCVPVGLNMDDCHAIEAP